ncbi:MAG: hypothetical protein ACI8YI_000469, partial [Paracoccaceae bacterium]
GRDVPRADKRGVGGSAKVADGFVGSSTPRIKSDLIIKI